MKLANRTVLLTGATSGIGLSLVPCLLARDASLILAAREPEVMRARLDERQVFDRVQVVRMDLSDPGAIEQGLDDLGGRLGDVDILINNAGQLVGGPLETQAISEIYDMLNVNLLAPIHLVRRLLPSLLAKDEALIVNNTSVNAIISAPCATTYAAAKAGLLAFGDALRRELRGTGIRLLSLLTPAVDTSMLHKATELYRGHFEVDRWTAQSADAWATQIVRAIEQDRDYLLPAGYWRFAAFRHFPRLFDWHCSRKFSRAGTFS